MAEEVKIDKGELARLKSRDKFLTCLQGCGLNNWEGYDEAIEIFDAFNADDDELDDKPY